MSTFSYFRALSNMPGVIEPTVKAETLSNVVILKLVYTYREQQQRAVFAFSRTNSIEAYQKYLEGIWGGGGETKV